MSKLGRPRVLITGGAGFLGSHLCRRYLNDNWEVLCLDNFHTGSKENIMDCMVDPWFELIRHDIVNPFYAEVDLILNFACPASPVHYQSNPIKTVKTNVMGTLNMLGLASRVGARLTQASTSEVYGDPELHPQPESYWGHVNPIGVRSCYDEGKRMAETLCFEYHRRHAVPIRVVRIFNTYGPNMAIDDGRVVSNFIVQALQNKDITVYGDGSQTRSFCYVDDLIEGIIRMTSQDNDVGPVNIGNPVEFTIRELADEVIRLTGSKSQVQYLPLPGDDPKQRRPDLAKAEALFGYKPKVMLREGLLKTIPYFEKALAKTRKDGQS